MAVKAGKYLRHDPIKLRFTTTNPTTGVPKMVLKKSLNQSISEILISQSYAYPTTGTPVILYEKLDISVLDLELKRSLKVTWTGIYNKEEGTYAFLLPKTSIICDFADHLSTLVTLSSGGTGKIRIFEISRDRKTQKEFTGSEMIGNIPDPVDLYAEVR
jgi:ubiquitin carboxyl-terminal hydrolase 7